MIFGTYDTITTVDMIFLEYLTIVIHGCSFSLLSLSFFSFAGYGIRQC